MDTEAVAAIRAETAELALAVTVTNTLLATLGDKLLNIEVLEINDILHQLEICAEHPAIEEYGIAHGGLNSILYRLCDVMKDVASAGHRATVAAGREAQAYPAPNHGPN